MSKITLYHGSSEIIENTMYGKGKIHNDYGRGFYCTEHLELAKEWACTEGVDGYANKYELEMQGLKVLDLSSDEYNILHWLTVLLLNRKIRMSTPVMKRGAAWLKEHFFIDVEEYDVIMGYRADDSYFSFARAFINNEISIGQLSRAMKLGKLGKQIVLKSKKAFESVNFASYELADNAVYYVKRKARDDKARGDYFKVLEEEDIDGIYMRDIIRKEVTLNDLRI